MEYIAIGTRLAAMLVVLGAAGLGVGAGAGPTAGAGVPQTGWSDLWMRDPDAGRAAADDGVAGGRAPVVRVEHRGERDWSLNRRDRMTVQPGDIYELTARALVKGDGDAVLCVAAYEDRDKVFDWTYAPRTARASADWQVLRSRFIVPQGITAILPRFVGHGAATVWIDSFSIARTGSIKAAAAAADLALTNKSVTLTLHTADATISVLDRRTGRTWAQKPRKAGPVITSAKGGERIDLGWLDPGSGLEGKAVIALDGDLAEWAVALAADGEMGSPLAFPAPFISEAGTYLVIPMNEGISYPVDDASIPPMRLIAYGGHGISMSFWGVTDGRAGQMAILETPDDAAIRIEREGGRLVVAPEWDPQKKRFGYERRVRYVLLDDGGHVAMCKRYRAYAQKIGLLKTLADKRKENPNVDLLVGAVNVWCWDRDSAGIVRQMQAAGIERILWSNQQSPESLKALNAMPGVLTSRYDIYQDVMDPGNYTPMGHTAGAGDMWPAAAWPKDVITGAGGDWLRGWGVDGKDGKRYFCGVMCDRQALPYAQARVPADLATHPYRCRFIDTTTAAPWHECYNPAHPMTRTESRRFKMDLLDYMSGRMRLVTGSETGHDAAVPYVHYFEGMLSLGPYRVPDSGRNMQRIWTDVPEPLAKFQLGHRYRLPLWELVYHDCVVAQWYWGDYNNKLPPLWDKRDLFNALYGTPPMFMFTGRTWEESKDRFVRSYRATGPVARATGYSQMTDHRFLAPDRAVQQTVFAGGVTVTANFGDKPFRLPDGAEVPAVGIHVVGLGK